MPKYEKMVYIEVVADDEQAAVEAIAVFLNQPPENITNIDLDGPIEEVD